MSTADSRRFPSCISGWLPTVNADFPSHPWRHDGVRIATVPRAVSCKVGKAWKSNTDPRRVHRGKSSRERNEHRWPVVEEIALARGQTQTKRDGSGT